MSEIAVRLVHTWPGFTLDVDMRLPAAGVTALFGHSGSGKTTVLRCIAGLERTQGEVSVGDECWQSGDTFVPPHRRPLGYVFQESTLFPHLNVQGNLDYARRRADVDAGAASAGEIISMLHLQQLLRRDTGRLSGGERQRVAIARALLINPRLLLMDEPLASLDAGHKQEILPYLEKLREQLRIPILYVSHSADEVARLADHLVVLDRGRAVASGPLGETLARLDFPVRLGDDTGVVLEARLAERDERWGLAAAAFDGGRLWLRDSRHAVGEKLRLRVLARDVSLALERHDDSSILNLLPGAVEEIAAGAEGSIALVRVRVGRSSVLARLTRRSVAHLSLQPGKPVWVQIKSVALIQ